MNTLSIGEQIKERRLELNLRMDDVAKRANTSRATLSSIENGKANYSINLLLKLFEILGLSFSISGNTSSINRDRASRINKKEDKKINRFLVMCIEAYAKYTNSSSQSAYKKMIDKGVINELKDDYEDMHGMSTTYINEYIRTRLGE